MPNIVDTKAISELRDRRVFYIPAYQRGYRWNKSQVDKLLDDLYAFCKKRDKADGEFYCLQPVIVKRLTDPVIREKMQMAPEETVYEVIDGQQRLTTLYLLLRFVIQNSMLRPARKDECLQKLFSLVYQTRENMWPYLRNIEGQDTFSNIDEKHARNAWEWIETWFDRNSTDEVTPEDMIYDFEKLLRQSKSTTEACGSVQIIWYEISEDQNVIREFLSTNNGKSSSPTPSSSRPYFCRSVTTSTTTATVSSSKRPWNGNASKIPFTRTTSGTSSTRKGPAPPTASNSCCAWRQTTSLPPHTTRRMPCSTTTTIYSTASTALSSKTPSTSSGAI